MKYCAECGTGMPDDAGFCPECGLPTDETAAPMQTIGGMQTLDADDTQNWQSRSGEPDLKPGDRFADRYEIVEKIGEGGMGVVYKATDTISQEIIALKLIRADRISGERAMKRLIEEGLTTRKIRHPNIIAVYDVGEAGGQPYVSMEFVEGQSLRAWHREMVQKRKDVPLRVAARIIAEALDGLKAAHEAGVIHRDLKPENIILTVDPTEKAAPLKILDFGIARATGGVQDTGTGTGLGTPRYMAPEQITNADTAGPAADLFSLSVMFYELLVDVLPQGHWQPPSGGRADVPTAIDALIERGLANRPASRPQSAEEYRKLLVSSVNIGGAVRRGGKVERKPVIPPEQIDKVHKAARSLPWRKIVIWGGGAFGALVLLGGLAQMFGGSGGGKQNLCGDFSGAAYQRCMGYDVENKEVDDGGQAEIERQRREAENANPFRNLSGPWVDEYGSQYQISVDRSGNFSGSGYAPDGTRLYISGQLSRSTTRARVSVPDLNINLVSDIQWDGGCHVGYVTYNRNNSVNLRGTFHANHRSGAPCP